MWVVKLATPSPPPSCLICTLSIPRRQVCRRLQRVIDSDNHAQLWSRASLDMVWVAPSNRAIMERLVAPLSLSRLPTHRLLSSCCRRAAQRGNVEATNLSIMARLLGATQTMSKRRGTTAAHGCHCLSLFGVACRPDERMERVQMRHA